MLSDDAATKIIERYPWLWKERVPLHSCLIVEASYWQDFSHNKGEVGDFPAAMDKAYEMMVHWIEIADDCNVDIHDPRSIADFISDTRSACVWATLISKIHLEETAAT